MAAALHSRETPADWDFLLTDVYPAIDREGLFSPAETKAEETARLAAAARESGRYLFALMAQGEVLEAFAASGRLAAFHEFVFDLRRDELLLDFLRRSFVAAARAGQLHVCEYLIRRGFPAARACPDLATALVDASVEGGEDDEDRGGPAPAFALLPLQCALPASVTGILSGIVSAVEAVLAGGSGDVGEGDASAPVLPAPLDASLLFLARRGVLDANVMRPHDGFTALHLAALHGACEIVAALIAAGADVNALAIDGETPLSCAQGSLHESRGEGGCTAREERCAATVAALEAAGALADWAAISSASAATKGGVGVAGSEESAAPRRPADALVSSAATSCDLGTSTAVRSTGAGGGMPVADCLEADIALTPCLPQDTGTDTSAPQASSGGLLLATVSTVGGVALTSSAEAHARLRSERLANATSASGGRGIVTVRSVAVVSAPPCSDFSSEMRQTAEGADAMACVARPYSSVAAVAAEAGVNAAGGGNLTVSGASSAGLGAEPAGSSPA